MEILPPDDAMQDEFVKQTWNDLRIHYFDTLLPEAAPFVREVAAIPSGYQLDQLSMRAAVVKSTVSRLGHIYADECDHAAVPFAMLLHMSAQPEADSSLRNVLGNRITTAGHNIEKAGSSLVLKHPTSSSVTLAHDPSQNQAWTTIVNAHRILGAEGLPFFFKSFPNSVEYARRDIYERSAALGELFVDGNAEEAIAKFFASGFDVFRISTLGAANLAFSLFAPELSETQRKKSWVTFVETVERLSSTEIPRQFATPRVEREFLQIAAVSDIEEMFSLSYHDASELVYTTHALKELGARVFDKYPDDPKKARETFTVTVFWSSINAALLKILENNPTSLPPTLSRATLEAMNADVQKMRPRVDESPAMTAKSALHRGLILAALLKLRTAESNSKAPWMPTPEKNLLISVIALSQGNRQVVGEDKALQQPEVLETVQSYAERLRSLTPPERLAFIRSHLGE